MTSPAQWTPPADAAPPADGWKNNRIARRAWLLGWVSAALLGIGLLVALIGGFVPDLIAILLLLLLSWALYAAAVVVALVAIVFGAVGVHRANRLGGYRKGSAVTGLSVGVAVILVTLVAFTVKILTATLS